MKLTEGVMATSTSAVTAIATAAALATAAIRLLDDRDLVSTAPKACKEVHHCISYGQDTHSAAGPVRGAR